MFVVTGDNTLAEIVAALGWRATLDEDEHYVYAIAI
jgi:hypothetical protein